jgi:hypothetical protein
MYWYTDKLHFAARDAVATFTGGFILQRVHGGRNQPSNKHCKLQCAALAQTTFTHLYRINKIK